MFFVANFQTLKINLFIFTIKVLRYSITIALFVSKVGSVEVASDLDSVGWLTENGEKKPVLKIIVQGENIELPLRQAPFCHLAETKECECFVLRKDEEKSLKWNTASFVKCGDKIRGDFMNSSNLFEIAPKENGTTGQHIVKNYKQENNPDKISPKKPKNDPTEEKQRESNHSSSSKFLRPLPEYGQLLQNETGYITIKFVVSKLMYKYVPQPDVNIFLQNYVNSANQYLYKVNLLLVYRGWTEASIDDNNTTQDEIPYGFVYRSKHIFYDKDEIHDALFLIGPTDAIDLNQVSMPGTMCHGKTAHFVAKRLETKPITKQQELQSLLFSLGVGYGLPKADSCTRPPKDIIWIMGKISDEIGKLQWANCTLEVLREKKASLACLRKKINSIRPICGNGQVEGGEECDCVWDECRGCCTRDCKLTNNSVCSNGPCCDISKCQVYDESTQCRSSNDFCDIPELCDGKSSKCPPNYVVANGYKCKGVLDKIGYCFNGTCGDRQDVCGWAFYQGSNAGDKCYDFNLIGNTDSGGCGPTFQSKKTGGEKYFACATADKFCGKVYCTQPGIEKKSQLNYTEAFSYYVQNEVLYSEIKDKSCGYMGLHTHYRSLRNDPTFVPNGSPCSQNSMCIRQTCSPLPPGCPNNCRGKKIKHPYTGEILPAFILDDGPQTPPSGSLLYSLVIIVLVILIIATLYMVSILNKRRSSRISAISSVSNQGAPSRDDSSKISTSSSKATQDASSALEASKVAASSSRASSKASKASMPISSSGPSATISDFQTIGRPQPSSSSAQGSQIGRFSVLFKSRSRMA